jgi:AcrR family transcriptional regulator
MPYASTHKARTRERILDAARKLFTHRGFERVAIDDVMAKAGLTRGGFYNHFRTKDELFCAAVDSYVRTTPWSEENVDPQALARWFIEFYLSDQMLEHRELQCPLFALPSDVSRGGATPKSAYTRLVKRTSAVFLAALGSRPDSEERANAIVSLCVGAMLLANTTDDPNLRTSLRRSARASALALLGFTSGYPTPLDDPT